jgi:riboflavin kinase/FMN adenylyltransferase
MRVHRGHRAVPAAARGAAVGIGNFDGVHLGHQAVLAVARARASTLGSTFGAVTFEPHPREVLTPDKAPARLTPLHRKLAIFAEFGVQHAYVLAFDRALMALSADAFVTQVLADGLGVRAVAVGGDFRFGHKRQGDVALLAAAGERRDFAVDAVEPVAVDGVVCSSSRIRTLLTDGDVAQARVLLGRPHAVYGRVVEGEKRGRQIGFPTANLRLPPASRQLLPAPGVYAVRAAVDDGTTDGVANLGWRPTFDGTELRLEIHLFDFAGDLYSRRLDVAFAARLRGELRFDGIDALKRQIEADAAEARRLLTGVTGIGA